MMNELVIAKLTDEQLDERIRTSWRRTKEEIVEFGLLLIEKKKRLKHGEFAPYLVSIGIPRSTATWLMGSQRPQIENANVSILPSVTQKVIEPVKQKEVKPWNESQPEFERHIKKLHQERLQQFDQRGGIIEMRLHEFITEHEPTGRDIEEAIRAIDKFEMPEDIELLWKIQTSCEQLAVRAANLARRLKTAIETKEKVV